MFYHISEVHNAHKGILLELLKAYCCRMIVKQLVEDKLNAREEDVICVYMYICVKKLTINVEGDKCHHY